MTTTPKRLFTGRVGATVTSMVALAADATVTQQITAASVENTDASDHTLTLWAPTGGSPGATNVVLTTLTIPGKTNANGGFRSLEPYLRGKVIAAGYSIQGQADVDGVLTVIIDGLETA
jgi:hypothetical protein